MPVRKIALIFVGRCWQERQRVLQLQSELQAARTEKDAKHEAQLQKLTSELSFKSDEVNQLPQLCAAYCSMPIRFHPYLHASQYAWSCSC
jgi:hypothetical protein